MTNNLTLFQFFHWYYSPEGNLWKHAMDKAGHLSQLGITHVWLPPAYKSSQGKQSRAMPYTIFMILESLIRKELYAQGMAPGRNISTVSKRYTITGWMLLLISYLIINMAVMKTESVPVQQVSADNRTEYIGEPLTKEAHTKFTFPGRNKQYSEFIWDWHCFSGIDEYDNIYLILK